MAMEKETQRWASLQGQMERLQQELEGEQRRIQALRTAYEAARTPPHYPLHVVTKGDTLWDLSGRYLGDPRRWPEIWKQNRYITNPDLIYPG
ncbi:MAG: LysM peptidoglycan-binding domain-containing protein, partial [Nitrospinota bacterium]